MTCGLVPDLWARVYRNTLKALPVPALCSWGHHLGDEFPARFCGLLWDFFGDTDVLWEHLQVSWPVSTEGSWALGVFEKRDLHLLHEPLRASEGIVTALATPAGNANLIEV